MINVVCFFIFYLFIFQLYRSHADFHTRVVCAVGEIYLTDEVLFYYYCL